MKPTYQESGWVTRERARYKNGKRSAFAMRRIKTYLRTTPTQSQLNNIMVLHIHRDLTDKVDHTAVLKEFVSANDDRRRHFGLSENMKFFLHCIV